MDQLLSAIKEIPGKQRKQRRVESGESNDRSKTELQHIPELSRMILDEELFWADSESVEVWSAVHQLEKFAEQELSFNAMLISDLVDLKAVEAAPVIEQAFAANQVDLMVQGDWEEVQIQLGLLDRGRRKRRDFLEKIGLDQIGE